MALYLDASALVALFAEEPATIPLSKLLEESEGAPIVTDFAVAETSAALARLVRIGARTREQVERAYKQLDTWAVQSTVREQVGAADVGRATEFVRQRGIVLRASDAIHLAAADRLGATVLTSDKGMSTAAERLEIACINPLVEPTP
jgi:uncharacterized protein